MPDFHSTPDKNSDHAKALVISSLLNGKKSQASVNYTHSSSPTKVCHNCSSYQNPSADTSTCAKVQGTVASSGVCDLWSSRSQGTQTPLADQSLDNAGSHHLAIRIHTGLNSSTLSRILTENPEG